MNILTKAAEENDFVKFKKELDSPYFYHGADKQIEALEQVKNKKFLELFLDSYKKHVYIGSFYYLEDEDKSEEYSSINFIKLCLKYNFINILDSFFKDEKWDRVNISLLYRYASNTQNKSLLKILDNDSNKSKRIEYFSTTNDLIEKSKREAISRLMENDLYTGNQIQFSDLKLISLFNIEHDCQIIKSLNEIVNTDDLDKEILDPVIVNKMTNTIFLNEETFEVSSFLLCSKAPVIYFYFKD